MAKVGHQYGKWYKNVTAFWPGALYSVSCLWQGRQPSSGPKSGGNMDYTWLDFIGNIGVGAIILAYLFLLLGRLKSKSFTFSFLNALGALFILASLIIDFNFSAFLMEAFWLAISVFGIFLYIKRKKMNQKND